MTVSSAASAPTAPAVAGSQSHTVRWQSQGFLFELCSTDELTIDKARRLFGRILSDAVGIPDRRWTVEQSGQSSDVEQWVVDQSVTRDSREAALSHIEAEALEFLVSNVTDTVAVHSALLSRNGHGILIVGPSLGGKSTLSIALWQSGWSLLSDDVAFVDSAKCAAAPAPRRVSIRKESRALLGEDLWQEIDRSPSCLKTAKGLFFHPHEIGSAHNMERADLRAVVFLARRGVTVGAAESSLINPAKGAVALLPYGLNIRQLPFMEALLHITPLANRVPFYDLGRGDLKAMIATVESLIV